MNTGGFETRPYNRHIAMNERSCAIYAVGAVGNRPLYSDSRNGEAGKPSTL
jgi:hypothetical protein